MDNPVILDDMTRIEKTVPCLPELNHHSVYITGSTGMIASYLLMFLIYLNECRGYHIRIYAGIRNAEKARMRFGSFMNQSYFHSEFRSLYDSLDGAYDYMIHAASLASPQYYGQYPVETILPNVIGIWRLLEHCVKNPVKSFLFFSSGSVYGHLTGAESVTEESTGNLDFLKTGNFYGESKRCGEALCRAFWEEYQVPVKSARIHHTYGPTLDPEHDTRVFAEFTGNILRGENIILKSDGTSRRAFCYLTDTASALLHVLLKGENGQSYNVGNSRAYVSMRELAEILVSLFPEKHLRVQTEKRIQNGYMPSTSQNEIPMNTEKIEQLGWQPLISIEEGFRRTVTALSKRR